MVDVIYRFIGYIVRMERGNRTYRVLCRFS